MRIVVIGCDKIGSAVVEQLIGDEHSICVVDIDAGRVKRAFDKYEITGVVGNGASYDVQKKAGARGSGPGFSVQSRFRLSESEGT